MRQIPDVSGSGVAYFQMSKIGLSCTFRGSREAAVVRPVAGIVECVVHDRLPDARLTRLRTIARRAYAFHSAEFLISMLFLCAGGIDLDPPLPAH